MMYSVRVFLLTLAWSFNRLAVAYETDHANKVASYEGQEPSKHNDINFCKVNDTEENDDSVEYDFIEYTAAVLEYKPYDDLDDGGLTLLRENARVFLQFAAEAKAQGAQIIVFPEHGLTSNNIGIDVDVRRSQSQAVPNAADEAIPCHYTDVTNDTEIMQVLSCGARDLKIYMVVHLVEQEKCSNDTHATNESEELEEAYSVTPESTQDCPDSGYLFYSTQVVFDDIGMVVAKYRKKHIYSQGYFSKGEQPDSDAIFTTNFGVTFTLQICFDIMYKDPAVNNIETAGVNDVIFSTNWIDELPFLTAPQHWKAWSEGNQVNLLASNYFAPLEGALGSGLFRGFTSEPATYVYNPTGGTTLVTGRVCTKLAGNGTSTEAALQRTGSHNSLLVSQATSDILNKSHNQENAPYVNLNQSSIPVSNVTSTPKIGENQMFLHGDLQRYKHSLISNFTSGDNITQQLCHEDNLCCTVVYNYPSSETDWTFMLIAYSGLIEKGGGIYSMYSQTCAVVFCLNDNITSCARIEGEPVRNSSLRIYSLVGSFSSPYIYPSVFTQKLELYDSDSWEYAVTETVDHYLGALSLKNSVENLLSLTLFSRWYARDP